MDIHLSLGNLVQQGVNGQVSGPLNRDDVIKSMIFKASDIVSFCASNVDYDMCTRDNFTDGAISRNGQSAERDMKELEPWIAESTDDDNLALESGTNGWDAHDMFRRNAEQFDVKSTYDENLSQYTTPLVRKNDREYRQKEEEAERIAREIESTDTYRAHSALENGDRDEEAKFSAVVRPEDSEPPPNTGRGPPAHMQPPLPQREKRERDRGWENPARQPVQGGPNQASVQAVAPQSNIPPNLGQQRKELADIRMNGGDPRERKNVVEVARTFPSKPLGNMAPNASQQRPHPQPAAQQPTQPVPPVARVPPQMHQQAQGPAPQQPAPPPHVPVPAPLPDEEAEGRKTEQTPEEKRGETEEKKEEEKTEAVGVKTVPAPSPTPPRQSPVVHPPPMVPLQGPNVYPQNYAFKMVPITTNQNVPQRHPKRAVVSVHPDPALAAHHATGQPLLAAQTASMPTQQFVYQMPQAVLPQGPFQMMTTRGVPPTSMHMSHQGGGVDPIQASSQTAHAAQQIFVQHMGPNGHNPGGPQPHHAHNQAAPPTSGTPQPSLNYGQQMGMHGHPPLQPTHAHPAHTHAGHSNPNPQGLHPVSMGYMPHTLQAGSLSQAGGSGGGGGPAPAHVQHSTHGPMGQPHHVVVMPQPPPHNVNQAISSHHHHHHGSHQYQQHHVAVTAGHSQVHSGAGQGPHLLPGNMHTAIPVSGTGLAGMHPGQLHHAPFVPPTSAQYKHGDHLLSSV
ncbi:hypothetical protein BaRGS_00009600 [Batillaria attramentaria]|uniref:LsmAD domain-containing protein n=1 Tax=Batillaria attramentaria TaxID=370345 RepID=A0ABD0LIW7_9CAEN